MCRCSSYRATPLSSRWVCKCQQVASSRMQLWEMRQGWAANAGQEMSRRPSYLNRSPRLNLHLPSPWIDVFLVVERKLTLVQRVAYISNNENIYPKLSYCWCELHFSIWWKQNLKKWHSVWLDKYSWTAGDKNTEKLSNTYPKNRTFCLYLMLSLCCWNLKASYLWVIILINQAKLSHLEMSNVQVASGFFN